MNENAQQSDQMSDDAERERQAYRRIPLEDRLAGMGAWIGASIAFGIGTGSFAIGIGVFLAMLFIAIEISNQFTKHRGCRKSN